VDQHQDWCISRQLWWSSNSAWYDEAATCYVARDEAAARAQAREEARPRAGIVRPRRGRARHLVLICAVVPLDARLAEDTKGSAFLPSSVLSRGFDIIFFWVARSS
jgi:valyl-tRNA synthetase